MSETVKWETNSEEMEDEDLIMEENEEEEEEEEEERFGPSGKAVYPEDFVGSSSRSNMSPRFGRGHHEFSRFDMSSGSSPLHGWNEAIDEKGESVALMMHLEKSVVHQKFFNSFDDDFDEEDLA